MNIGLSVKSFIIISCLVLISCGSESSDSDSDDNTTITISDTTTTPDPTTSPDPITSPDPVIPDPSTPDPAVSDMARANSYDDAWETEWVANVIDVLSTDVGITKTEGKVLHVGDSMTRSFAYGLWARTASGATDSDIATINWMYGNASGQDNGWDLSSADITAENAMGWSNPKIDNIYIDPLTNDAQFAILMMNLPSPDPNDVSLIQQRVNEFKAAGIMPILSTIPPRTDPTFDTLLGDPYNEALRLLAENLSLPLIDYSKEILLRRPNGTWENTLISGDGHHPSGGANGYDAESNPYIPGGDPSTHTTGDAVLNSGYLLRTWLAVQKIKEIKSKAID